MELDLLLVVDNHHWLNWVDPVLLYPPLRLHLEVTASRGYNLSPKAPNWLHIWMFRYGPLLVQPFAEAPPPSLTPQVLLH